MKPYRVRQQTALKRQYKNQNTPIWGLQLYTGPWRKRQQPYDATLYGHWQRRGTLPKTGRQEPELGPLDRHKPGPLVYPLFWVHIFWPSAFSSSSSLMEVMAWASSSPNCCTWTAGFQASFLLPAAFRCLAYNTPSVPPAVNINNERLTSVEKKELSSAYLTLVDP